MERTGDRADLADGVGVADAAFDLFMATVEYADLNPWEKRAYRWHRTAHGTQPYDPDLEAQIAAYKARKEGKTA